MSAATGKLTRRSPATADDDSDGAQEQELQPLSDGGRRMRRMPIGDDETGSAHEHALTGQAKQWRALMRHLTLLNVFTFILMFMMLIGGSLFAWFLWKHPDNGVMTGEQRFFLLISMIFFVVLMFSFCLFRGEPRLNLMLLKLADVAIGYVLGFVSVALFQAVGSSN